MRNFGFLVLPLLLVACSQEPETPVVESEIVADDNARGTALDPSDQSLAQSLADPTDEGPTRAADSATGTMPDRFHGVWDFVDGTCNAASDLRLEIGPDMLVFYESTGAITGVNPRADGGVDVKLAMSGEGEYWEETNAYRLSDNGRRLIAIGSRAPGGGDMVRKRCPA
ncbi:MAG: hypothetical protein WA908_04385 [Pontixanthobacter sp.]